MSRRFPPRHAQRTFEWHDTGTVVDKAGLGKLGVLPFETLQQILVDTDMRSLIRLQSVCKNMRRAVDTIAEFHTLLRCTPDTIRIMTAAKVDSMIACRELYRVFCRPMCDLCDKPGEYLYLLACHRLCFHCLRSNPRYRPLRPMEAVHQFDFPVWQLPSLPMLQVPKYSPKARYRRHWGWTNTTGWRLIDREVALRHSMIASRRSSVCIGSAVSSKLSMIRQSGAPKTRERLLRYYKTPSHQVAFSASVLFPYYDEGTGWVCKPCVRHVRTPDL